MLRSRRAKLLESLRQKGSNGHLASHGPRHGTGSLPPHSPFGRFSPFCSSSSVLLSLGGLLIGTKTRQSLAARSLLHHPALYLLRLLLRAFPPHVSLRSLRSLLRPNCPDSDSFYSTPEDIVGGSCGPRRVIYHLAMIPFFPSPMLIPELTAISRPESIMPGLRIDFSRIVHGDSVFIA